MAKALAEIRSLARAHTATALKTLEGIMRQAKAPASARVAAAQALLDRGWGKAPQEMIVSAGSLNERSDEELDSLLALARRMASTGGGDSADEAAPGGTQPPPIVPTIQ